MSMTEGYLVVGVLQDPALGLPNPMAMLLGPPTSEARRVM